MAETIGTAYVQIEPSFEGVSSKINKEMGDAGTNSGKSFGSGFGKVLGTSGAIIGGITTAVGALGAGFVKAATDVATYGDNIDKTSQKLGISATAYQEWEAVMEHSGTSMESLTAGFKTLTKSVTDGTEEQEKAWNALGTNVKTAAEEMSAEERFDYVISALQGIDDETERAALAQTLLGRSAMELGPLLNTSAEETQAMKDTVHELGGVLSDEAVKASAGFQDQLQDLTTSFDGLKNNLIAEFLPSITEVMGGLTDIFSGDYASGLNGISNGINHIVDEISAKLPEVMKIGTRIILTLGKAIVSNAPDLISAGMDVIKELALGLTQALPTILDTVVEIITTVIDSLTTTLPTLLPKVLEAVITLITSLIGHLPEILASLLELVKAIADSLLTDVLPMLIQALPDIILGIVNFIIESIPQIIAAVIDIITAIVEAFPTIIAKLVEAIPEIIVGIITALLTAIPQLVMAGIQLFISLITALPQIIIEIVKAIPEIITGIVNGLKENWPQIKEAGKELLTQIMEGLTNIGSKISNAVKKIWNALKEKFTEMSYNAVKWGADMLSNFIEGIKSKISAVTDAVSGVAETIKNFLGFSEPEEGPLSNFHTYAPDMMKLFAQGIEDNEDMLKATVTEAFDFQGSIESGYATPDDNSNYEETIVSLLQTIAERSGVQIDVNSEGLFNIMRSKNYEYSKRTGRSAFV